jgi:hypothetical protein
MANEYFDHSTYPATGALGTSSAMRSELDNIEAGFDKLPTMAGNGGEIVAVNAGGTALEAITTTGTGSGVRATSPTLTTPLLGTPTSGTLTNCTGHPVSGLAGAGTGVLTFLATPSSANLAAALTDETGSGLAVFATSPTLTTPVLGVATATSINKVAITAPATSATLTLADGSSLVTSGANSITLTSTGATNVTLPTSGTLAVLGANTFTGAQALGDNNLTGIKVPAFNAQGSTSATTGATTVDWSTGAVKKQTEPTGAITYTFTAPGVSNVHLQLLIDSDGTSTSYGLTWPAEVVWYGLALSATTANKKHVANFWYDGTTYHGTFMTEV